MQRGVHLLIVHLFLSVKPAQLSMLNWLSLTSTSTEFLEGIEIIMDEDSGSGKQAFEFLLHWIQRLYSHVDII